MQIHDFPIILKDSGRFSWISTQNLFKLKINVVISFFHFQLANMFGMPLSDLGMVLSMLFPKLFLAYFELYFHIVWYFHLAKTTTILDFQVFSCFCLEIQDNSGFREIKIQKI